MAYNASYTPDDVGSVSVDLIVGIGAFFVSFVALVGLILLWRWVRGKKLM